MKKILVPVVAFLISCGTNTNDEEFWEFQQPGRTLVFGGGLDCSCVGNMSRGGGYDENGLSNPSVRLTPFIVYSQDAGVHCVWADTSTDAVFESKFFGPANCTIKRRSSTIY